MLGHVETKPGVEFAVIAPGGYAILAAVQQVAAYLGLKLRITSGTDGEHSGPEDPHHSGNAYDVGSQEFSLAQKETILAHVMAPLGFDRFYGFLEDRGTDNEHIHIQVAKGTTYP